MSVDPPETTELAEFREIVRRNMAARSVSIVAQEQEQTRQPSAQELCCVLPGGRLLVVSFDSPVPDADAARQRLDALVESFSSIVEAPPPSAGSSSVPCATSLHDEVVALAERAGALDVLVIDARSPVVWDSLGGSFVVDGKHEGPPLENVRRIDEPSKRWERRSELMARAEKLDLSGFESLVMDPRATRLIPREICEKHCLLPLYVRNARLLLAMSNPADLDAITEAATFAGMHVEPVVAKKQLIELVIRWNYRAPTGPAGQTPAAALELASCRHDDARSVRAEWARYFASRKAIAVVRGQPEMRKLHKGAHLFDAASSPDFGYIARSFAGIYVLILVFVDAFDELRAKRAMARALPRIEGLVLSLPPRDPPPSIGGAIAMRMRHRR